MVASTTASDGTAAAGGVDMNLYAMTAIIIGSAVLGVALMAVVRRLRTTDELFHDSERGSDVFGFVGSAFALLLAFVIVAGLRLLQRRARWRGARGVGGRGDRPNR